MKQSLPFPSDVIHLIVRFLQYDMCMWIEKSQFDFETQTNLVCCLPKKCNFQKIKRILAICGNMDAMKHFDLPWIKQASKSKWTDYCFYAHSTALKYIFEVSTNYSSRLLNAAIKKGLCSSTLPPQNLQVIVTYVTIKRNVKQELFLQGCIEEDISMLHMQLNILKWTFKLRIPLNITAKTLPILKPHLHNGNIKLVSIDSSHVLCMSQFTLLNLRHLLPNPNTFECYRGVPLFMFAFAENLKMSVSEFCWNNAFEDFVLQTLRHALDGAILLHECERLNGWTSEFCLLFLDQVCDYLTHTKNDNEFHNFLCRSLTQILKSDFSKDCLVLFENSLKQHSSFLTRWMWPFIQHHKTGLFECLMQYIMTRDWNKKTMECLFELAPWFCINVSHNIAKHVCKEHDIEIWQLLCKANIFTNEQCWNIIIEHWNAQTPKKFLVDAFDFLQKDIPRLQKILHSKQNTSMIHYVDKYILKIQCSKKERNI